MPLYRYHCRRCDHEFEDLVARADVATAVECPECKGTETERALTTFAVGNGGGQRDEAPFCGRCGENRPPCGA